MIRKGTIVKRVVTTPVKVEVIGKVDDIEGSTLKISKSVVSIKDEEFVRQKDYTTLTEDINDCSPIDNGNDFDSIYDIIGREMV